MSEPHYQVIDIDDPERNGLYRDFDSVAKFAQQRFYEKESTLIKFRPVRRSDSLDGTDPWNDVNMQSADIYASVGYAGTVLAGISTGSFANDIAGIISVVNRQTGTATKKSVQRVRIDNHTMPTDGNLIINFNRPELTQVQCKSNRGTAQVFTALFSLADIAGDKHLQYDDLYDLAGPVRIYFNNGSGGGPPPVPAGGRLLSITYVNGDAAAVLCTKTVAALNADGKFTCIVQPYSATTMLATATQRGPRANPINGTGATGIAFTLLTAGVTGPLTGKTFKLFDQVGSIGVWFGGAGQLVPAAAVECNRNIMATVTDDDVAATVTTALQTAIDADAEFTASVIGGTNTVLITDITGGAREDAVDIDTDLGITIKQNGKGLTYNGPFSAGVGKIEAAFEGYFNCIRRVNHDVDFKAIDVGPQPLLTVDTSDLEYPNVLSGTLPLNTVAMAAYFAAQLIIDPALQYVLLELELKIGFSGGTLETRYRTGVRVYRTIFDAGVLPAVVSSNGDQILTLGYIGGAGNLDGLVTAGAVTPRLIFFYHVTDGLQKYTLLASTAAEASPGVIRPDDFNIVTNQRVWFSA